MKKKIILDIFLRMTVAAEANFIIFTNKHFSSSVNKKQLTFLY